MSLTINHVNYENFEVMLIPHTLEVTNLNRLKAGDRVNIEYDYLAKLAVKNKNEAFVLGEKIV